MKKNYETPILKTIQFEIEEKLMVSVTVHDKNIDNGSVKLPSVNIFG